jgi:hypothetical protein
MHCPVATMHCRRLFSTVMKKVRHRPAGARRALRPARQT